jgi:mannuronan 5-epimerase
MTGDPAVRGLPRRLRHLTVIGTVAATIAVAVLMLAPTMTGSGVLAGPAGLPMPVPSMSDGSVAGALDAVLKDTAFPIPAGAVVVAPTGADTAAGTASAPLRTLAAAVRKATPGGTVVLRAGLYREGGIHLDKRLTLQPAPHEQVWISGADVVRSWVPDGSGWRATGWTSPLCQDCYPAGAIDPAHPLAGLPDQVLLDGVAGRRVGSRASLTRGTFFVDPTSKALYIGDDPRGSMVEASSRWLALRADAGAAGSVIRGLGFTSFAPHWNQDQLAQVIIDAPASVVTDNTFARSSGCGLGVFASDVTVVGNAVVGNGGAGGCFNRADRLIARSNLFSGNNARHFKVADCRSYCTMAGLKITHSASVTVESNSFTGNDGHGFWCDEGCTEGTVRGNTASQNTGAGLYWEVSSQAVVSGNTMSDNGIGMKISGADHVTASGNAFIDNVIQLGLYDDPRSSSSDPYSATHGLSWNTTATGVTGNSFAGGGRTSLLLDTNATAQVNAGQMLSRADGNTASGETAVRWCPGTCVRYPALAAFVAASRIPFGTTAG